jgi:hypothetical protein
LDTTTKCHDEVPAVRSKRHRGQRPRGGTIKYLRGAAGIGLGTTVKYLRRTTSATVGGGLGTAIKHLVKQNMGAFTNWANAHTQRLGTIFLNSPVL